MARKYLQLLRQWGGDHERGPFHGIFWETRTQIENHGCVPLMTKLLSSISAVLAKFNTSTSISLTHLNALGKILWNRHPKAILPASLDFRSHACCLSRKNGAL